MFKLSHLSTKTKDHSWFLFGVNRMSEGDFLGGPSFAEEDVRIDPIFSSPLTAVLENYAIDARIDALSQAHVTPIEHMQDWPVILHRDGITYRQALTYNASEMGVIATNLEHLIIGAYVGCSLAVDPAFGSRGIGTCLVMLRGLTDECLPLWDHDKPAYSPAGYAVHLRAYEELRSLT
jgi:hypothetical protein